MRTLRLHVSIIYISFWVLSLVVWCNILANRVLILQTSLTLSVTGNRGNKFYTTELWWSDFDAATVGWEPGVTTSWLKPEWVYCDGFSEAFISPLYSFHSNIYSLLNIYVLTRLCKKCSTWTYIGEIVPVCPWNTLTVTSWQSLSQPKTSLSMKYPEVLTPFSKNSGTWSYFEWHEYRPHHHNVFL